MMGYFDQQLEKAKAAGFDAPLAAFINTDRDGHHSLNYPAQCGALKATLDHTHALLCDAAAARGSKATQQAFRLALEYVAKARAEHDTISRQWDVYRAAREARSLSKE